MIHFHRQLRGRLMRRREIRTKQVSSGQRFVQSKRNSLALRFCVVVSIALYVYSALMDSTTLKMASPTTAWLNASAITSPNNKKDVNFGYNFKGSMFNRKIYSISPNGSASSCAFHGSRSSTGADEHRQRSNLESLFCYDKAIPEERIEKPVGLSLDKKSIGNNVRCCHCQAKGALLCTTCAGSGLYVDSILESQGIIVKVRCLGCGGSGNMMCTECGGRGHLGAK